jgi:hypothetical protein
MRTQHIRAIARSGSAMTIAVLLTTATAGLLVATLSSGLQRSFAARKLTDRLRAQAIAEAGACHGYNLLAADFTQRTNSTHFLSQDYGGGHYQVKAIAVGKDQAVIDSTGTYRDLVERVILDTRLHQTTREGPGETPYLYAIISDHLITWTGCGVFEGGAMVHANGQFQQSGSGVLNANGSSTMGVDLKGASGSIDGNVDAPIISGKTAKITGTQTIRAVTRIPIPQIDLAPYYERALKNHEVYSGNQHITVKQPVGGVMWVDGNLKISGQVDLTGCFIATGSIDISGNGVHQKVDELPAFISRDSSISLSGDVAVRGLIYARIGDINFTGGGNVTGSIICGGNFKKAGSSTVICYQRSVPRPPDAPITDGVLCVSAWQR